MLRAALRNRLFMGGDDEFNMVVVFVVVVRISVNWVDAEQPGLEVPRPVS